MPEFKEVLSLTPTIVLVFLILAFLLKAMPTWKELRLRELELRGQELEQRGQENVVKGEQAKSLALLADVLKSIAVEQRRATETIEILQRVNSDTSDSLNNNVRLLTQKIGQIEDGGGTSIAQVAIGLHKLDARLERLETHVEPESSRAGA